MNPNIKVWNLSFGALRNDNFTISPHGILLDKLSSDGQRIFVVAAGNDRKKSKDENHSLNSPADSINSISVGSVHYNNDKNKVKRTLYSSLGFSLQTMKPDISDFGGPTLVNGQKALIHDGVSLKDNINGTSLSAPKITRQIAYLISEGYTPQEAKSKVISMTTKEKPSLASSRFGYGLKKETKTIEISQEIITRQKDLIFSSPINIPDEIEEIYVSISYPIEPLPILGHESAIYDINASLSTFNFEKATLYSGETRTYGLGTSLNNSNTEIENKNIINEIDLRFKLGKYSTTKKRKINWQKEKNKLIGEKIALKIKRQDLHDIINWIEVKVALNIRFTGKNLKEEDFIKNNEIFEETEIEIESETLNN